MRKTKNTSISSHKKKGRDCDLKVAVDTIQKEINGLNALLNLKMAKEFKRALSIISKCKGKVVVSGMGKSGHIGNKIAATLASTGTPAIFIHPSEASHGDLGMVQKKDCLLLISNSGETREMRDICLFGNNNEIPTISIVGNKESFLYEKSTVSLVMEVPCEAIEHIAVPTVSTTMTLAIGDAMACCLLKRKKFSVQDYNHFHPGGKLGLLSMKVKDVMKKDIPLVEEGTFLKDAIITMSEKAFGLVGVVKKGKLTGVITDGDLRRHLSRDALDMKVEKAMTKRPKNVYEEDFVSDAIRFLNKNRIVTTFVKNKEDNIVGIVQIYDMVRV